MMPEPDNQSPPPPSDPSPIKDVLPPEAKSFFMAYLAQVKAILTGPRVFFDTMPVSGGLMQPLVFLAASAAINAFLSGLLKMSLGQIVGVFFGTIIATALAALVASLLSNLLGGKGDFEGTFRAFAYSEAPQVLAWLPMIGLLATVYVLILNYYGLRKVHDLPAGKTVLVVILSGILTGITLILGACGVFMRSILHF